MYCTIVNFRASYEDGIRIDSHLCKPWGVQKGVHDVMQVVTDPVAKQAVFDTMTEAEKRDAMEMSNAYSGMNIRAQFNNDVRGPYIFHTEDPLTDQFLLDWAEVNVFKKRGRR